MDDSNGTSNDGPPYKESNTIAGHILEGEVRVEAGGLITVTRADGKIVPLKSVLERFELPRRLRIEISTPHTRSTHS